MEGLVVGSTDQNTPGKSTHACHEWSGKIKVALGIIAGLAVLVTAIGLSSWQGWMTVNTLAGALTPTIGFWTMVGGGAIAVPALIGLGSKLAYDHHHAAEILV